MLTTIGPPVILVASGYAVQHLTVDELTILTGYRLIREQAGSMIVEFNHARSVTKWDVKPNFGNANTLNQMLQHQRSDSDQS